MCRVEKPVLRKKNPSCTTLVNSVVVTPDIAITSATDHLLHKAPVSGLALFVAYFIADLILKLLIIQMDAFRIAGALVIGAIKVRCKNKLPSMMPRFVRV